LAATRARLATAYGERASLAIAGREGGGVVVRIRLPRVEVRDAPTNERQRPLHADAPPTRTVTARTPVEVA
ncbi:MAG: hypothetical protein H7066_20495, partial [Cytophagaceae bacterium]|nr:hypothetical protein [Gemmatimonadaceae bacterium]